MSKTLWWVLAASIFVAIAVMIGAVFLTYKKVKRLKTSHWHNSSEETKQSHFSKLEAANNYGNLLLELKNKFTNPLDDLSLDFVIKTIIRNGYKTSSIFNRQNVEYETESLKTLAKQKISNNSYDLALIFYDENILDIYKDILKKINTKGMAIIVNAKKNNKIVKTLLSDLKLLNYRHEYVPIDDGIIIIAI